MLDRRQVIEPHLTQFGGRNHQPLQHLAVPLLFGQQLQRDVILLVSFLVGRDLVLSRDHQPHCAGYIGCAHTEIARAPAIDLNLKLRAVQAHARLDVEQTRYGAHFFRYLLRQLRRFQKVGSQDQRSHREVHLAPSQCRRDDDLAAQILVLSADLANFAGHLQIGGLAPGNIYQPNVDMVMARQRRLMYVRVHKLDFRNLRYSVGDLHSKLRCAFDRCSLRPVQRYLKLALIVGRNKIATYHRVQRKRQCERCERNRDDDYSMIQRPLENSSVGAIDPTEEAQVF